jgi:hypothetical protein
VILRALLGLLVASSAAAQERTPRRVEIAFTPTGRAQIAVWVEAADRSRWATIALTESVAYRGIGNRPGATQMNSGYRWPYGRREGVLPVWAHARLATGRPAFPRVIFDGRGEGHVSGIEPDEPDNTRDDHFCLSLTVERSQRDGLDAITCASAFFSNKGRYLRVEDRDAGYAEPWQDADGDGRMRALSLGSLYPGRRDLGDRYPYDRDARALLPEIDAITMATPAADLPQHLVLDVPDDWPDGEYVAYVEIHVEGDYGGAFPEGAHPTPIAPGDGAWDEWSMEYGYAYRGQPSVVYRAPFSIAPEGSVARARDAAGHGALHGESGGIFEGGVVDDPEAAPGSGADRLRRDENGDRLVVTVPEWDACARPDPPPMCNEECPIVGCGGSLLCGPGGLCADRCAFVVPPGTIDAMSAEASSHRAARISFIAPESARGIARYELRIGTSPIHDATTFLRALPAVQARAERVELVVPIDAAPGELVEVEAGGLSPETTYYAGVRAIDECNARGPIAVVELTTPPIEFTTVSPCFIATAAYGSDLEPRVGALRRLRDRHLRTNAVGRSLVDGYESIGPHGAAFIRDRPAARAIVRGLLWPVVALASVL